jgi:hypothetical protein
MYRHRRTIAIVLVAVLALPILYELWRFAT